MTRILLAYINSTFPIEDIQLSGYNQVKIQWKLLALLHLW